jgi:phycocyanobilin lyase beta subunit
VESPLKVGIGDPRALPNLLDAIAHDFALSVRRAAAKGLGFIHWEWLPEAERPAPQTQVLDALCTAITDEEWVVRYATVMGLEALARQAPQHQGAIAQCWAEHLPNEPEIAVRARIFRAQTRI